MSNTNPEIKEIQVGTRVTRKVYIYPLSMNDQFKLVDCIAVAIQKFADTGKDLSSNTAALELIKQMIKDNLDQVLEFVCDPEERPTLDELTNSQFFQLVDIIFSVNFETTVKNFQSLFQRAKSVISNPTLTN